MGPELAEYRAGYLDWEITYLILPDHQPNSRVTSRKLGGTPGKKPLT